MLSHNHKLRYASGNFGKSLLWSVLEFFLLYHLTDFLGFDPAVAGIVVLLALVWDALTDPVIGYLADRYVNRGGTYAPFLRFAPPLLVAAFIGIFSIPPMPMSVMVTLAIMANLVFRTLFTLYDVPHNALLAIVSDDSRERSTISGFRFFFSSLASLFVAVAIYPVLVEGSTSEGLRRVLLFVGGIGILAMAVMWLTVGVIKAHPRKATQPSREMPMGAYVRALLSNGHTRHILLVASLVAVSVPVFSKLLLYYATYNLGNESWGSPLLVSLTVGQMIGLPFWVGLSHSVSKARVMQVALSGLSVVLLVFYIVRPADLGLLMGMIALAGIAIGGIYTLIWAIAPDVVESLESTQGKRLEAGVFSLLTLSQKVSIGIGAALAGLSLDWAGFVPDQVQSVQTLDAIPLILCGIPGVGALIAAWVLQWSDLDHEAHASLRRKLKAP